MPCLLVAVGRDYVLTDVLAAADAYLVPVAASNWSAVELAKGTAEACLLPAHLAEGDLPRHQHHLRAQPEVAGWEASYFGWSWAAATAVADPFAAGDAAGDWAVVVAVAVGWTVGFAAVVVESVDSVFPMLLRNLYDEADSLGVESVLNYSFHQNSKGFSAADH